LILATLTCFCAILNCFATNIELYIIPFGYSSVIFNYILVWRWVYHPINCCCRTNRINCIRSYKFFIYLFS